MSETAEATLGMSLPALFSESLGDLVDSIAALDRMLASLAACRADLVDQARQFSQVAITAVPLKTSGWDARTTARRELVTELACALRVPERSAERLLHESEALMHDLPATRAALELGAISYRHAQVMVDHAQSLPEDGRAPFESAALPFAQHLTVAKFDRKARVLRERVHPDSIAERHVASAADRSIDFAPGRDGMAWLTAHLPAPQALAIYNRVGDLARGLQGTAEPRTLTQLRADVFTDLLVDGETGSFAGGTAAGAVPGAGWSRGVRAQVLVNVPVMTLLGSSEEPGSLEGYGPIDADTARRLAARAPSFMRILTHPETGAVLSVGRTRYAVPADLRTWLRVRDETCRFPACHTAARSCELDHTRDWQRGGDTAYDNLAHLCKSHHNVKHHTAWTVAQREGGALEWTSPLGRKHLVEPETRIRPG